MYVIDKFYLLIILTNFQLLSPPMFPYVTIGYIIALFVSSVRLVENKNILITTKTTSFCYYYIRYVHSNYLNDCMTVNITYLYGSPSIA